VTQRHFGSFSIARINFRDLLDTARTGRVTTVTRQDDRFTVVESDLLRRHLTELRPAGAVVAAEAGGWSAYLPGTPIAGDGDDLDAAIDDLISALRDYADDWNERLFDTPNHRQHWALVMLTELSDDTQLREWILHHDLATTA
jgi:hypothetical protein